MASRTHTENLYEARLILELAAVQMAAEKRTSEDLRDIKAAQVAFYGETLHHGTAIEEDLLFHLKVVAASQNAVLKSLFMKILPDLFDLFDQSEELESKRFFSAIHEHERIIEHIIDQNKEKAVEAMEQHLEKWKN